MQYSFNAFNMIRHWLCQIQIVLAYSHDRYSVLYKTSELRHSTNPLRAYMGIWTNLVVACIIRTNPSRKLSHWTSLVPFHRSCRPFLFRLIGTVTVGGYSCYSLPKFGMFLKLWTNIQKVYCTVFFPKLVLIFIQRVISSEFLKFLMSLLSLGFSAAFSWFYWILYNFAFMF